MVVVDAAHDLFGVPCSADRASSGHRRRAAPTASIGRSRRGVRRLGSTVVGTGRAGRPCAAEHRSTGRRISDDAADDAGDPVEGDRADVVKAWYVYRGSRMTTGIWRGVLRS